MLVGMIEEVVELGPGYRAVTRSRSAARPVTMTTLLLPLDGGGCVLRLSSEQSIPMPEAEAVHERWLAHHRLYLSRVRDLAEASLDNSSP